MSEETEARLQAYSLEHAKEITFEGCCYRIVSPETCDDVAATLKAQDIELDRLRAALAQAEAEAAEPVMAKWHWYNDELGTLCSDLMRPPFGGMKEGQEVAIYTHPAFEVSRHAQPRSKDES